MKKFGNGPGNGDLGMGLVKLCSLYLLLAHHVTRINDEYLHVHVHVASTRLGGLHVHVPVPHVVSMSLVHNISLFRAKTKLPTSKMDEQTVEYVNEYVHARNFLCLIQFIMISYESYIVVSFCFVVSSLNYLCVCIHVYNIMWVLMRPARTTPL